MSRRARCVMCDGFTVVENISRRGWCLKCEAEWDAVMLRAQELCTRTDLACDSAFACVAARRCLRVQLRLVVSQ